jgi:hypothetical protein
MNSATTSAVVTDLGARRSRRDNREALATAGRLLHQQHLRESRARLTAALDATPTTPDELAAIIDQATGGALADVSVSDLLNALAGRVVMVR